MNELNEKIELLTRKLEESVVLVRKISEEVDKDVAAIEELLDRARALL